MRRPTIRWHNGTMELLDQTLLPHEVRYIQCESLETVAEAIRKLRIRGAPAIGLAAASGMALVAMKSLRDDFAGFLVEMERASAVLAGTRPTAVNLFWALRRMEHIWRREDLPPETIRQLLMDEALAMIEEDRRVCRLIGQHGVDLLPDPCNVLTHCNAGYLATADYGTALAPVYVAQEIGRTVHVWADETRPLLQGARLTAWELQEAGVPVTLICDDMAASTMASGSVDLVITGADRIAANGDTANKIGTLGLAVLARYFKIPFYVAAPISTIDFSISTGLEIPIEERDAAEVTHIRDRRIAPSGIAVSNPAFDVTPATLISAIVTEKGVHRPPYGVSLSTVQ